MGKCFLSVFELNEVVRVNKRYHVRMADAQQKQDCPEEL